jgi:hypothetical protein
MTSVLHKGEDRIAILWVIRFDCSVLNM